MVIVRLNVFLVPQLSVLLAGKRSVPQSVFIHVNISTSTNKIPRPLIEVKHQLARKETCVGGWCSAVGTVK